MNGDLERQIAGVSILNDPVRRALFHYISEQADAVSREQAAEAVGIQKTLAAFHLEKLTEQGLLQVEFRRMTGRSGPGAGRPAKLYQRSELELDVSLPPREYDLAARLLAEAIVASEASGRFVREELEVASHDFGRGVGTQALRIAGARSSKAKRREALMGTLRDHGFEPRVTGQDIVLSNCPFHLLAQEHTELVCGMNLHLMAGLRAGLDVALQPRLEPTVGQCCVKFCTPTD